MWGFVGYRLAAGAWGGKVVTPQHDGLGGVQRLLVELPLRSGARGFAMVGCVDLAGVGPSVGGAGLWQASCWVLPRRASLAASAAAGVFPLWFRLDRAVPRTCALGGSWCAWMPGAFALALVFGSLFCPEAAKRLRVVGADLGRR